MLVPVTPNPVPTVEEFAKICPDPEGLEKLIYFTCIYDVSGHPTITLPAGLSPRGDPIAFQLVSRYLGEDLLVRAGKAWQEEFTGGRAQTSRPDATILKQLSAHANELSHHIRIANLILRDFPADPASLDDIGPVDERLNDIELLLNEDNG